MKKVIVIGAGILGSSAAYHLAKKGAEVIMIDKCHQGQATAAGAGIICPWISNVDDPDWYRMSKAGALYYPSLISQLKEDGEEDFGYSQVGALSVSNDPEELDKIEQKVRQRKMNTPEVGDISRLTAEEARRLFPPLREDLAAVHVTGAARLDGRLLRDALQCAAKKHGAEYKAGEARLAVTNGKVTGAYLDNEWISADAAVVAAGAWTSKLLKPLGVELTVEPQRGQILHIQMPEQDTSQWPVVLPQSSHYLLAFADSRVVVGATRETGAGFDYRVTVGGLGEVIREALSVAPGLSAGTMHEVRIGFRPAGPDILPQLGTVPNISGLVIATGLGASGLTMGPYVGCLAAKMTIDEPVEMDLTPYNPVRGISKV
ncbi:NAD(P)/FAD-dependent oxidoreductase [Scopulibacillus cellulosilyticus]|uniref:NAD(P)/FAD-dependent oxidoreductase n=1 Tax=Scopulibacillus cellulosilyticus TaxID=2665665 RepID=A0ABW2Q2Y0_9BACL